MLHCVGESSPQGISPVRTVVFSPTPSETFNILQFSEKHNTISKRLRDYDNSSLCLSQIQFDNLIFTLKINQSRLFFPAPAKKGCLGSTTLDARALWPSTIIIYLYTVYVSPGAAFCRVVKSKSNYDRSALASESMVNCDQGKKKADKLVTLYVYTYSLFQN